MRPVLPQPQLKQTSAEIANFQQLLFSWWRQEGRILPWRKKEVSAKIVKNDESKTDVLRLREESFQEYFAPEYRRDPYKVVIAEVMLQQTQVERVVEKYRAWMLKWPTVQALAAAPLPEVFVEWQGLGYNRRARFLWLLAQAVVENGGWPKSEDALLKLPGIGKYTARAILAFALGEQVGVVDTNVQRILLRVLGLSQEIPAAQLFTVADQILPVGQADPWNQALMDFGALICTSRSPKCVRCPLANVCSANQMALQEGYANYAEKLSLEQQQEKRQNVRAKVRFEDTDRFFRGRMMDILRNGSQVEDAMQKDMQKQFGLEPSRFQALLNKLIKEQMVEKQDARIGLAGHFSR